MRINLGSMSLARKIDIGPYIEYRLLTNIKKPQNVFMVGLAADWATREPKTEERRWSAVVIWSINYKNDFELATKSVQTNLLFTPVANDRGGGLRNLFCPNVPTQLGSVVELTYSPSIGFEHEGVLRAPDQSLERTVVRAVSGGGGTASVAWAFGTTGGARAGPIFRTDSCPGSVWGGRNCFRCLGIWHLELNFEYSYVYDLMESTDPDGLNRGHQLVAADANVWFVRTDAGRLAGMSLRYTNGESPKAGFRQQQLTELTISVKF